MFGRLRCRLSGLRHTGHVLLLIANTKYLTGRPVQGLSRFRYIFDWLVVSHDGSLHSRVYMDVCSLNGLISGIAGLHHVHTKSNVSTHAEFSSDVRFSLVARYLFACLFIVLDRYLPVSCSYVLASLSLYHINYVLEKLGPI